MERRWDTALAMCHPDIVYMPADHPVLRGHAALQAWLEQFPPIVKFTRPLESVERQGDLAVTRNSFTVTIDHAGTLVENTGKALGAWQKDRSGRWVVKVVCWNWDRPISGTA
jgi:ketosteroid isomerase-like protein